MSGHDAHLAGMLFGGMVEKKRRAAIEAILPRAVEERMNIATSIELRNGFYEVACILVAPGQAPPGDGEWEVYETSRPAV